MAATHGNSYHTPILLLMKGHPGTGKSTLARELARKLRWPLIDKDDVRDCTLSLEYPPPRSQVSHQPIVDPATPASASEAYGGLFLAESTDILTERLPLPIEGNAEAHVLPLAERPADAIGQRVDAAVLNNLSYEVMWRVAATQLEMGLSVVVDCPLARPQLFLQGSSLGARHGARVFVVECRPGNQQEWRRRLEARAREGLANQAASSRMSVDGTAMQAEVQLPVSERAAQTNAPALDRAHQADMSLDETDADCPQRDSRVACRSEVACSLKRGPGGTRQEKSDAPGEPGLRSDSRNEGHPEPDPASSAGDERETGVKGQDSQSSRFWHKPSSWQDIEKLLARYEGCWEYDTGSVPRLVIDSTALSSEGALQATLEWLHKVLC